MITKGTALGAILATVTLGSLGQIFLPMPAMSDPVPIPPMPAVIAMEPRERDRQSIVDELEAIKALLDEQQSDLEQAKRSTRAARDAVDRAQKVLRKSEDFPL